MHSLHYLPTHLAWTFTHLLPGTFKRNKYRHHDYPILAPLPHDATRTAPLEGHGTTGPFIYFVVDALQRVCYVGKCAETSVIKRWVRPGNGGPATHYWSHSTSSGGNVFNIASGLRAGHGPYHLRYMTLTALRALLGQSYAVDADLPDSAALAAMEARLILDLRPLWNR